MRYTEQCCVGESLLHLGLLQRKTETRNTSWENRAYDLRFTARLLSGGTSSEGTGGGKFGVEKWFSQDSWVAIWGLRLRGPVPDRWI